MRYYIYCDESGKKGNNYSNFYGGIILEAKQASKITDILEKNKLNFGIFEEIKWTKTNEFTLDKYKQMIDLFFDFIRSNKIKVRIMFTSNKVKPNSLTEYQKEHQYHLLYYQFLKHAFGLRFAPHKPREQNSLEIFFDFIPDKKEKNDLFKSYIYGIQHLPEFIDAKIKIEKDHIAEVDSKSHILMQCLDVVLGAMYFRLNALHKEIPEGKKRRGKRTIAKEKLYKHILTYIQQGYPNFNIGISTGLNGDVTNIWNHPYRHWCFKSKTWEEVEYE